jgi:hypothetical protein
MPIITTLFFSLGAMPVPCRIPSSSTLLHHKQAIFRIDAPEWRDLASSSSYKSLKDGPGPFRRHDNIDEVNPPNAPDYPP